MSSSSPALPTDRHAIGQLLVRLLTHFRQDLFNHPDARERFPDTRFAHLQIWGNVGVDGIRLTDLAERATLSLAACSELVNELQTLGYLERRPDPTDGRAKLIFPTTRGRELLGVAGGAVAELEERWRRICPPGRFDDACRTLDDLLRQLD
jgi:DNA-binding MarR family transcriptional regulator